jgi:hypothetical protein
VAEALKATEPVIENYSAHKDSSRTSESVSQGG